METVDVKLAFLEADYDNGWIAGYLGIPSDNHSAIFLDGYMDGADDKAKQD
jgi:hypothetical protein